MLSDTRIEKIKSSYRWMKTLLPEFSIETLQGQKDMAHMISVHLYRSWTVKLPYSSVNASLSEDPKSEVTEDHIFSAQNVILFLFTHPELWKEDFNKFLEYAIWGASTITVTKKENALLSKVTYNVPTLEKYEHKNIKLVEKGKGKIKGFPIKEMPKGWDEWEQSLIAA